MKRLLTLTLSVFLLLSLFSSCQTPTPTGSLPQGDPTAPLTAEKTREETLPATTGGAPATEEPPVTQTEKKNFDPKAFLAKLDDSSSQPLFYYQFGGPGMTEGYLLFSALREGEGLPKGLRIYYADHYVTDSQESVRSVSLGRESLPAQSEYDALYPVLVMDQGSMQRPKGCELIVQLTKGDVHSYVSFDNLESEDPLSFVCRGELPKDRLEELKDGEAAAFRRAQRFYRYIIEDFLKEPSKETVYEAVLMEDEITCYPHLECTHPFRISLPQINGSSDEVKKYNADLMKKYGDRVNEALDDRIYEANEDIVMDVRYQAIPTGDVITLYVYFYAGLAHSGAVFADYDIVHYHTGTQRFLSTEEFLKAYAAEPFRELTVGEMVKQMNAQAFANDEEQKVHLLKEEDVVGVIPSVFGEGKFDVVYDRPSYEGSVQGRDLFIPDAVYTVSAEEGTVECIYTLGFVESGEENPIGGYRLGLKVRRGDQIEGIGIYPWSRLLLEDISKPSAKSKEERHVLFEQDADGSVWFCVDHESNEGHWTERIPFTVKAKAS